MRRKAWIAIGILCFAIVASIAVAIGVSRVNSSKTENAESKEPLNDEKLQENQFDASIKICNHCAFGDDWE